MQQFSSADGSSPALEGDRLSHDVLERCWRLATQPELQLPSSFPHGAPLESMHSDASSYLVHESRAPIFSPQVCQAAIAESEAVARLKGGWTSKRHLNHPTTDIPLQELPVTSLWFNWALVNRIYPFLGQCFGDVLPNPRALRVADAFIVKYNASGGQRELAPHRDGSVLSFNIALNERGAYAGGGTWFAGLNASLPIEQGHILAHASGVLHGGHPIDSGIRYILVGFVLIEGYQNWAMRFMNQVWDR